jgi:O-acetylserine/cysteine efflux transporter
MKPFHIFLGIVAAAIWGFNFVVLKVALADLPPILLTALRFLLSCIPILFLAKPKGMRWVQLVAFGLTTFLGQYVFLFIAMQQGMPAGLSSITMQLQVFITILLSVAFLGERLDVRQIIGVSLAFIGLCTIATTVGEGTSIPLLAMLFIVLAATSWAFGNMIVKQAGSAAGFATLAGVAWASLPAIVPAFVLSYAFEGPERWLASWHNLHILTIGAVAYLVVLSTWFCFSIWSMLLSRYPAGTAAPFALLVPVFGMLSGYVMLDEVPTSPRLLGAAMIFTGLVIILLPVKRLLKSA